MSSPIGSHNEQWVSGDLPSSGDGAAGQTQEPVEPTGGGGSQGPGEAVPSSSPDAAPQPADLPAEPEYDPAADKDGQSLPEESDLESYENFFGMREPPFTLTPNPAFFFVNERGREGLKQIEYGIRRREGFAVISGDVGTGKTTLCWALLERLEKMNVCTALVQNPMVSATDVLKLILHDLGVRPKPVEGARVDPAHLFDTSWMAGMGQIELIERLNTFLIQMARKGLFTVVIIDEAQRLSMETLEQLRLLSNLETANEKLLQIIFVGQAELEQMLEKPELRQLNQRISVRFQTKPLGRDEVGDYIRHRLRIAWAIPRLQFKKRAFDTIYRMSGGYPRLINMICDRALSLAFRQESYVITPKIVRLSSRSIREISPSRTRIWMRRLALLTATLVIVLLIAFLLLSRHLIPGTRTDHPAIPIPAGVVVAASNEAASNGTASRITVDAPTPVDAAVPTPSLPAAEVARSNAASKTAGVVGREEYVLQAASLRDSEGAKSTCEELKARGIPSFLITTGATLEGNGTGSMPVPSLSCRPPCRLRRPSRQTWG